MKPKRRIDTRRHWFRLTWEQQDRYCHLADLFGVDESGDDPTAESEADYLRRREWQAQQNANADDAARYGVPAQYGR